VHDAIDAAMSDMEYLSNLQPGEAYLMEPDDRSLHRIGTFYGLPKSWPDFCPLVYARARQRTFILSSLPESGLQGLSARAEKPH
jgi:hypothetical protein